MESKSRQTIEEFLFSIDEDLLKYADSFRKHGFTNSSTMKYIQDNDLTSLIAMPEGHKRLILNVISKLRSPDTLLTKKRKELPSPGVSPEIKQGSKRTETMSTARIRRSLPMAMASWNTESEVSETSTESSCKERSRRSLLLSPAESFVKSKQAEIRTTEHEICQRKHELDEMLNDIKDAAKDIGGVSLKCSNCHLRNHTVRSCVSEKCESPFDCGDLNKHSDAKSKIVERKKEIGKLQVKLRKLQQEHAGREAAFTRVHNSINKDLEDMLIDEFPDEYTNNGVRNWLKLQRDVAYVKRGIKSSGPPKREVVMAVLAKRNEEDFERSIGLPSLQESSVNNPECGSSATRKKLESYGVKYTSGSRLSSFKTKENCKLFPCTPEEETEQVNMATSLSALAFDNGQNASTSKGVAKENMPKQTLYDSDAETQNPCAPDEEVANILLSLTNNDV